MLKNEIENLKKKKRKDSVKRERERETSDW